MDVGGATLDRATPPQRPGPGDRPRIDPDSLATAALPGDDDRVEPGRDSGVDQRACAAAVRSTSDWLLARQAADGHWRGPLEGDTILESEYILILAWADRLDRPEIPGAVRRILGQQLPGGGWAIYPGGPVDVSASVKAYLALKITGHDPRSEPLARARRAIAAAGGPWAVNSFTKFYLALLGQMTYSACPAVPPEMVLLPDWFPINLHRVSAWSRTMIVPLSLIWEFKPSRPLAAGRGIEELFAPAEGAVASGPVGGSGGWARFFRGVDRVFKACDALGMRPFRSRAVAACRRWMLERFDGSDGLGAIFPPIVWSIVALRAMGCDDDSAEVQECWRQLERLIEREPDGTTRLEPCRSPVWDTAISLRALSDGASVLDRPRPAPESVVGSRHADDGAALAGPLAAAVDWLLDREIRGAGDWVHAAAPATPSGWCFQYANRFYPDVDDTAMVLIALATWRGSVHGRREAADSPRMTRVAAAIGRAVPWLESMQSSDGGWGAFDRDNDMELLCKVPFADHNAMIDPSSPDLAGRVLEAFGKLGMRTGRPSIDRAIDYLRATQEDDGSWYGRWGVNYIYGTWQAIEGLRAVGLPPGDAAVAAGAGWLVRHQQPCGGWGETPESYADRTVAGRGAPTASQTAWALAGLVAAGAHDSREARRAARWLLTHQAADGSWPEAEFTGTGFPKVFYLRYHYYPVYFPLMAVARFLAAAAATVADGASRERVA
ncbi:MAG: squalene--hopene cyclase [Planctomycetia bacterium]|nr:squalene--hopene cyclase [Planctomycetia bacterium]